MIVLLPALLWCFLFHKVFSDISPFSSFYLSRLTSFTLFFHKKMMLYIRSFIALYEKTRFFFTPIKFFKIIFLLMYAYVFTQVYTYSCYSTYGCQKTASMGHFLSTMWVLGIELRLSGLTANACIYCPYCPPLLLSSSDTWLLVFNTVKHRAWYVSILIGSSFQNSPYLGDCYDQ